MTTQALTDSLKRLRLSGILETFEGRLSQAREAGLSHTEWLSLLLQDELERRDANALANRFKQARFEEEKTFEGYELGRYPLAVQHLVRDLMTGGYVRKHQHIAIVGPTGTGKTHLAQALGHQACRQGIAVRFVRMAVFLREMQASRADASWMRVLKRYTTPGLLVLDDFGLTALTFTQAEDLYELIVERHLKASFIITSNRKIESWAELFPDAAMGNAAVDRLLQENHTILLDGDSYRTRLKPHSPKKKESSASQSVQDA